MEDYIVYMYSIALGAGVVVVYEKVSLTLALPYYSTKKYPKSKWQNSIIWQYMVLYYHGGKEGQHLLSEDIIITVLGDELLLHDKAVCPWQCQN